jgi:hypothetical protein
MIPSVPPPESAGTHTMLEATVQLLTFAPGVYAVDFIAPRSAGTNAGLHLPCARLDPVPGGAGGRCFVCIMAEGGWLSGNDQPTLIRAVGANAGVVLTIYKASGQTAAPELRIRRVPPNATNFAAPDVAPPPPVAPVVAPAAADEGAALAVTQTVHVQGLGDLQMTAPQWAGQPGSGRQMEGFAILPTGDLAPEDIEYQAILGENWNTPWVRGGAFCGSRNMGIALMGVRIRLVGAAAERFECRYWGSFMNIGVIGPRTEGEGCDADRAVLEALRVVITRRTPVVSESAQAKAGAAAVNPTKAAKGARKKASKKRPS